MKKIIDFLLPILAVTLLVAVGVSCNKNDVVQESSEPNQELLDLCISNMADPVKQLHSLGLEVNTGTRAVEQAQEQAAILVDQLACETQAYLSEIGWTENDFNEMNEVANIEEAYAWFAVLLVAESGGLTEDYADGVTRALTWGEVGHCALEAIGVDFLVNGLGAAKELTQKALKKAFATVAKRMLGPIGVAIAAVEFGACLIGAAV